MTRPDLAPMLMDARALQPLLAEVLPALRTAAPGSLRLHQVRRRVSRQTEQAGAAWFSVAFAPADPGLPGADRLWCGVRAYSLDRSREAAAAGEGRHLPGLDAVAWSLVDDPALPQLRLLMRGDALPPGAASAGWALASREVRRYEPGSHALLRLHLVRDRAHRTLWVKVFADGRWHTVADHLTRLAASAVRQPQAFLVAPPAGHCAVRRCIWQDEVAGEPLHDRLQAALPEASRAIAMVADGLARLQALPPWPAPALDTAVLGQRAGKQARKLLRADAGLGRWVTPLLAMLAAPPAEGPPVMVHGDCHAEQFQVQGRRLLVFDLDNLAQGQPAHDVADFASQLLTDERLPPARRRVLARAFLAEAARALGPAAPPDALAWHLRVLLLRKAYSQFVHQPPGWAARCRRALRLAGLGLARVTEVRP